MVAPRSALALIAMITAASNASAQRWGITGGAAQTDVVGKRISCSDLKSPLLGIQYRAAQRVGSALLQPELQVTQKGTDCGTSYRLGYVEAPILLRYGAVSPGGMIFTVGPAVSYMPKCSVETQSGCNLQGKPPWIPDIRRFDLGLIVGGGFELRADDGGIIGLDLRFDRSLIAVFEGRHNVAWTLQMSIFP
jgi:hypothetical protein